MANRYFYFSYLCTFDLDPKLIGYNQMCFLLESLNNLNDNLTLRGGCLHILHGNTVNIFKRINEEIGLDRITYEQVNTIFLNNSYLI